MPELSLHRLLLKNTGVQMAEKITYLLERPDLAKDMGWAGRMKVEADFAGDKHVTRLLEIYYDVIQSSLASARPNGSTPSALK